MGFRDRMKKNKRGGGLKKRHQEKPKESGGRYPTIFIRDKIPEGIEFYKCKEGEHLADIIPFEAGPDMPLDESNNPVTEEGDLDYVLDLWVHQNLGKLQNPYVCPYENFGKPCPACEFIKGNRLEKDDWSKLRAKHRVIYQIWDHQTREGEKKGIQIFEAAYFFMEEKIDEIAKLPKGGGYISFSDPDSGKTLAWKRKGSGKDNTQYLGHKFIDRDAPIPDKILNKTFALDSIIKMHPSYEDIEKDFNHTLAKLGLLTGSEDVPFDDDEPDQNAPTFDDDEDNGKKGKKGKGKKRKRPSDRKAGADEKGDKKKKKKRKRS